MSMNEIDWDAIANGLDDTGKTVTNIIHGHEVNADLDKEKGYDLRVEIMKDGDNYLAGPVGDKTVISTRQSSSFLKTERCACVIG